MMIEVIKAMCFVGGGIFWVLITVKCIQELIEIRKKKKKKELEKNFKAMIRKLGFKECDNVWLTKNGLKQRKDIISEIDGFTDDDCEDF
jgi:rRNA-processing protein FCF1